MRGGIAQKGAGAVKITLAQRTNIMLLHFFPVQTSQRRRDFPRLIQTLQIIEHIRNKTLRGVRPIQRGRGLLRLCGEVNAPFLAYLGKMLINGADKAADGLGDGLQAGLQLRQGLVPAPSGDVAQGIGAGVNTVILADGKGHAFGLHLHRVLILGLGRFLVRIPGSGGEAVLLPVMEDRVADLMD
ncbi:MAG: hypothetical protein HFJ53_08280, partial [Clostridia bacterium]|nr:hypothetical protein [Clostridia bacterium]